MKNVGVIFDLDGVIVSTDDCHYQAWKQMAQEEQIYFDRQINERLRGVSRMASLEIVLERATKTYTQEQKIEMASRKNNYYIQLIENITPEDMLPGAHALLSSLKEAGIPIAIGSSSRNTPAILTHLGLFDFFDAVADGNCITHSKPDPEVFTRAADGLHVSPSACLVVEDADAGIEAANRGGMISLGVGFASQNMQADYRAVDLSALSVQDVIYMLQKGKTV